MSAGNKKLFFIVGATGTQGGATAKELIKAGHGVRFLTRNPSSDNANELRTLLDIVRQIELAVMEPEAATV
jgi:uncharacterized protein YbjT (DUF2867 family)